MDATSTKTSKSFKHFSIYEVLAEYDKKGMIELVERSKTNPQKFRIILCSEKIDEQNLKLLCIKLRRHNYDVFVMPKNYPRKIYVRGYKNARGYKYNINARNEKKQLIVEAKVFVPREPDEKKEFPSPKGNLKQIKFKGE